MRKVAIIGSGGAGKSTFATQLGDKLDIPVYHLDKFLWRSNWTEIPKYEQRQIQQQLILKDEWIIDGNYGSTMDVRLQAADTIIFLDIHRVICVYRAVKRMVRYWNRTRPDMADGCNERFDFKFLKWIWNYPTTKRPAILQKLEEFSAEKKVIILASKREVKEFIQNGVSRG